MLRKIEAFLNPSNLEGLRDVLLKKGIEGMSFCEVQGFGLRSKKDKNGKPVLDRRMKVEIVTPEGRVEEIIREIKSLAGTGDLGQGILFVVPVEDALRISTREVGTSAVRR
jgi:nitrogen regulatory protein PII